MKIENQIRSLADRLRRGNYAYLNEEAARTIARAEFASDHILILHSAHDANPTANIRGKTFRLDYWIDEPGIVRSWETVLFDGHGKNA